MVGVAVEMMLFQWMQCAWCAIHSLSCVLCKGRCSTGVVRICVHQQSNKFHVNECNLVPLSCQLTSALLHRYTQVSFVSWKLDTKKIKWKLITIHNFCLRSRVHIIIIDHKRFCMKWMTMSKQTILSAAVNSKHEYSFKKLEAKAKPYCSFLYPTKVSW